MKKTYNKPQAEVFLIEDETLLAGVSGTGTQGTDGQSTSGMGTGGAGNGNGAFSKKTGFSLWDAEYEDTEE